MHFNRLIKISTNTLQDDITLRSIVNQTLGECHFLDFIFVSCNFQSPTLDPFSILQKFIATIAH